MTKDTMNIIKVLLLCLIIIMTIAELALGIMITDTSLFITEIQNYTRILSVVTLLDRFSLLALLGVIVFTDLNMRTTD